MKQSKTDDADRIEMKNNNIYGQLPQQQVVKNPAYNWWKPTTLWMDTNKFVLLCVMIFVRPHKTVGSLVMSTPAIIATRETSPFFLECLLALSDTSSFDVASLLAVAVTMWLVYSLCM